MVCFDRLARNAPLIALVLAAGCAAQKPQVSADLSAGLEVATALESVYAARPSADPKTVAEMVRLLNVAQAAIVSWENSSNPADQAAVNAAIAALLAYEASAGAAP